MSDSQPPTSERFPDLYALLGLNPLERDPICIQQALKRLAASIKVDSTDPALAQQRSHARKLFELGKQHLLDPQRKLQYDQRWQTFYGSAPAAPKRVEPSKPAVLQAPIPAIQVKNDRTSEANAAGWDLTGLQGLLPAGDPTAPYRGASHSEIRAAEELSSRYDQEFDKLKGLLAVSASVSSSETPAGDSVDHQVSANADTARPASLAPTALRGAERAPSNRPTPLLARRLRKKQEQNWLWGIIVAFSTVAIVLGVAYWLMQADGGSTVAIQPVRPVPVLPQKEANSLSPMASADRHPASRGLRSGLPSVPAATVPAATVTEVSPAAQAMPQSDGQLDTAGDRDIEFPLNDRDIAQSIDSDTTTEMQPTGETPPTAEMFEESMSTDMPSEVGDPNADSSQQGVATLSDEERAGWAEIMSTTRQTIGRQEYDVASRQLDEARALATTPVQKAQLERLAMVSQLAQICRDAIRSGIGGLGAAETITVGKSTVVSFVEGSEDHVTVRVEAKQKSYRLTELPSGLAFGLADLSMDRAHPRSLAAKAAFVLVHPAAQGKEVAMQRAKEMMSEAIQAAAVSPDMNEVFTDDYKLP